VAAVLILVFRRLGLKPKWPVLRGVFAWTIAADILFFLITYAAPYIENERTASVAQQTLIAYIELLGLGLPYAFGWLWATRVRTKSSTK
jgi:hypothetical protein